jgi:hypothetical protein
MQIRKLNSQDAAVLVAPNIKLNKNNIIMLCINRTLLLKVKKRYMFFNS